MNYINPISINTDLGMDAFRITKLILEHPPNPTSKGKKKEIRLVKLVITNLEGGHIVDTKFDVYKKSFYWY